jgi:hypothetical protein
MTTISSVPAPGPDNQSGYFYVPAGLTAIVDNNKQMVCFGPLIVDGVLLVNGQLILEP